MTVDITALSRMVREFDVSATLKTFTVVVAFLVVVSNLSRIFVFILGTIKMEFLDSENAALFVTAAATGIVFSFGPLTFLIWDWMARKPWRHLAAVVGALLGGVGFAAIGGAIGFVDLTVFEKTDAAPQSGTVLLALAWAVVLAALGTWMISESKRIRWAMVTLLGLMASLFAAVFVFALIKHTEIGEAKSAVEQYLSIFGIAASVAVLGWFCIRAIRHRIVLSGDRPRELMLGALHRKGLGVRLAYLTGLPSSLWNLRAMTTTAFWAFLFSRPMVYAGVVMLFGAIQSDNGPAPAVLIGTGLIIAGHLFFYTGKRLAARYIWVPDNPGDTRQPVLFLRSFENDQMHFKRPWWDVFGHWFDLWSFRRNADEAMIDEIAQYGPVVALGMPGEQRVPFGAKRYYATHDDWQKIITDTARNAQAIVIGAGDTPGVLWEYSLLARENLLDRTLLLFASEPDQSAANVGALKAFVSACDMPDEFAIHDQARMIALLATDDGPTLLTARDATAAAHVVAVRAHFQKCTPQQLADSLVI